jgi:hypothetical protein
MKSGSAAETRVVFVHHSVGRYMIKHGRMRDVLAPQGIALWDCDYNKIGSRNAAGARADAPPVPDDNTDPDGLLRIFTRGSDADRRLTGWLQTFKVVVLKSCYPASNIATDEELAARKELYDELVGAVCERLTHTVITTPPPLVPARTTAANAARACDLARWLLELTLPNNVTAFDLHGLLAHPGAGGDGTLARRYRRLLPFDSHPNAAGAQTAGKRLAEHVMQVAVKLRT